MTKRVVVVGASGYAGAELVGLLASHPEAEIIALAGSSRRDDGPSRFSELFPRFAGVVDLPITALDTAALLALEPDAVFLATPHELSHELAPVLVAKGVPTFDLSAAFRLPDAATYPSHYGFAHEHPELLPSSPGGAVYGLPELFAARIADADLIAVPGCYPTSAILPLRPLVDAGLLRTDREIIIDSTSGVSGAGRKAEVKSLFCEVSMQAYGVFKHRHRPEIAAYVTRPVCFTPHLGSWDRGILSTIHAWLAPGADERVVRSTLANCYADQPFVRLLAAGAWPSVGAVERSNFCDIGLGVERSIDGDHLLIESAIDNLVKGAAGQALQCFNVRFGLLQTEGLLWQHPISHRSAAKEAAAWNA
ncbi:MAG: N-acetyl-gamma-glutamyl-phosphate reductase [Phycisphaerae bacterium]|jgi:N-acetyl-gamma-glutamyl-phosphate reductase|nr:N-acetyl-gamma-glutamyl-phosphate reductase [Phycisphaerae bacterium]